MSAVGVFPPAALGILLWRATFLGGRAVGRFSRRELPEVVRNARLPLQRVVMLSGSRYNRFLSSTGFCRRLVIEESTSPSRRWLEIPGRQAQDRVEIGVFEELLRTVHHTPLRNRTLSGITTRRTGPSSSASCDVLRKLSLLLEVVAKIPAVVDEVVLLRSPLRW